MARLEDPLRNFRFVVECDGLKSAGFSDVSGYDMSVDVIEYRSGEEMITPRKLPGLRKHGNITLKRGVITSPEMFDWINQYAGEGKAAVTRKSISYLLTVNIEGNTRLLVIFTEGAFVVRTDTVVRLRHR